MDFNALLKAFYTALLEAANPELVGALHTFRADGSDGLDDVFLPGVSDGYQEAPLKVMVIGRERHWRYGKPATNFPSATGQTTAPLSIRDYVERGMVRHAQARSLTLDEAKHNSDLIRLLREVASATTPEGAPLGAGLVYANLFAVALNGDDPRKAAAWPHIRELSKALLDVQIDVLKPDVIVFANGIDSAPQRKLFFPHKARKGDKGRPARCSNPQGWLATHGIEVGHLYGFTLDERIECYRIHHPSSAYHRTKAAEARTVLLELLGSQLNGISHGT